MATLLDMGAIQGTLCLFLNKYKKYSDEVDIMMSLPIRECFALIEKTTRSFVILHFHMDRPGIKYA